MSKHTPGPWLGQTSQCTGQGLIYSETTGANVAVAYDGEKDTALIAAAPDLYEALKAMSDAFDIGQRATYNSAIGKCRAALRKAEGE